MAEAKSFSVLAGIGVAFLGEVRRRGSLARPKPLNRSKFKHSNVQFLGGDLSRRG
jgi:hypothetical protein